MPQETGKFPYPDGVYTGSGEGYGGTTKIELTLKNGTIQKIHVVSNEDDEAFFKRAETLISLVIQRQSTDVDAVSGATFSSEGILEAIQEALEAAKQAAQAAGASLFVLDGAVIVGTAAQAECDRLCVVTAPFETSVARIVARDGISPEMAARRLNAQTPEQTLTAQADYTLHNDAGLEALQAAAARLCERLQAEGGVTAAL